LLTILLDMSPIPNLKTLTVFKQILAMINGMLQPEYNVSLQSRLELRAELLAAEFPTFMRKLNKVLLELMLIKTAKIDDETKNHKFIKLIKNERRAAQYEFSDAWHTEMESFINDRKQQEDKEENAITETLLHLFWLQKEFDSTKHSDELLVEVLESNSMLDMNRCVFLSSIMEQLSLRIETLSPLAKFCF